MVEIRFFKRSDVKDNPVNVNERVQRNIEQGKGYVLEWGKVKVELLILHLQTNYGEHQFETLDFVPLINASYSGGIIITD